MSPISCSSFSYLRGAIVLCAVIFVLSACGRSSDVTLYVALDQEHSEELVKLFEADSGLVVNARFDSEAQKTVGLVNAILEEQSRPRCDVFWNNELGHTVRLAQKGVLVEYESPSATAIPAMWKDAGHLWTGFAARARVLIVNTDLIPDAANYPKSMWDLTDPKWKGRCAVALPLTGTTLTHFTTLAHVVGEEKLREWIAGMKANDVQFLQSNGATMRQVATGKLAFAFTDTDDYHVALTKGHPVTAVFPDQGEGQVGTMLIPNSVGIIKGGPNPEAARKLVDFILSEQVESLLAAAKSAQIPLRASVKGPTDPAIKAIGGFRAMVWDPAKTAAVLDVMSAEFQKTFGQ